MAKLENKAYQGKAEPEGADGADLGPAASHTEACLAKIPREQLRERLAHSQGRKGRSKCELAQLFFPTFHQGLLGQRE